MGSLPHMDRSPNKVRVVVDRAFGDRLRALEPGVPVWIVGTPANRIAAQRLWQERPSQSHLTVTVFGDPGRASPEDVLLDEMEAIDLHLGTPAADGPYAALEVLGAALSDRLEVALSRYGFSRFEATAGGFSALRTGQ